ncbi:MAG: ATP-binding protein [Cyanobacteriota bacterium]|nr:ATP-binding protein [Cyanobacteriota bacterium]
MTMFDLRQLFQNCLARIPPEHQQEFLQEIGFTNYLRSKGVAWLLLLIIPFAIYIVDIINIFQLSRYQIYRLLFVQITVWILTIGYLFLCRWKEIRASKEFKTYHAYLNQLFVGLLLLFIGFESLVSLTALKSSEVYILGMFTLVSLFYFPGLFSLFLISLIYTFYLIAVYYVLGQQPTYLMAAYLIATLSTFLAWLFSRYNLFSRASDFLSRQIIQQQAASLTLSNQALQQRNQDLAILNQEKNEFLGIVVHDLKNPLTAIQASAEILLKFPYLDQTQMRDLLQRILTTTARMSELIRNLLDINAIEQGELHVTLSLCDLSAITASVKDSYEVAAQQKGQTLHFQGSPAPALLLGDPNILIQIVDNLVSNAIKYSYPQQPIWLAVEVDPPHVRLQVRDQGPGMTTEDQEKLFGKFVRLSALPTGGEHSTGLGLSIVKRLVEALNGRVWCDSQIGVGSTFIVEFPQADVSVAGIELIDSLAGFPPSRHT